MATENINEFVFYSDKLNYKTAMGTKGKEFFIEGYISTGDIDLVNDIVTKGCMDSMLSQFDQRSIKLDFEHETFRGKSKLEAEANKTRLPLGRAVLKDQDSKGVKVKWKMNENWKKFDEKGNVVMDFKDIWSNVENEMLDAFSIAYVPTSTKSMTREGKDVRMLDNVNLLNVALTGNPINPAATMSAVMAKSLAFMKDQEETEFDNVEIKDTELKYKYTKRTGNPGNYTYEYPDGSTSKNPNKHKVSANTATGKKVESQLSKVHGTKYWDTVKLTINGEPQSVKNPKQAGELVDKADRAGYGDTVKLSINGESQILPIKKKEPKKFDATDKGARKYMLDNFGSIPDFDWTNNNNKDVNSMIDKGDSMMGSGKTSDEVIEKLQSNDNGMSDSEWEEVQFNLDATPYKKKESGSKPSKKPKTSINDVASEVSSTLGSRSKVDKQDDGSIIVSIRDWGSWNNTGEEDNDFETLSTESSKKLSKIESDLRKKHPDYKITAEATEKNWIDIEIIPKKDAIFTTKSIDDLFKRAVELNLTVGMTDRLLKSNLSDNNVDNKNTGYKPMVDEIKPDVDAKPSETPVETEKPAEAPVEKPVEEAKPEGKSMTLTELKSVVEVLTKDVDELKKENADLKAIVEKPLQKSKGAENNETKSQVVPENKSKGPIDRIF